MTVVRGTLTTSLENADRTTRRVAAHQGMMYVPAGSRPGMLVFRTGIMGSGPRLAVSLVERAPSTIEVTITTDGRWALTGWGRGNSTANRLLRALMAQTGPAVPRPESR